MVGVRGMPTLRGMVRYVNEETSEATWKHPCYDHFADLLDQCRHLTREEHMKLRIDRMLMVRVFFIRGV